MLTQNGRPEGGRSHFGPRSRLLQLRVQNVEGELRGEVGAAPVSEGGRTGADIPKRDAAGRTQICVAVTKIQREHLVGDRKTRIPGGVARDHDAKRSEAFFDVEAADRARNVR